MQTPLPAVPLLKYFTEFAGSGRRVVAAQKHPRICRCAGTGKLKYFTEFAGSGRRVAAAQKLPRISRIQWCLTHVEHHRKWRKGNKTEGKLYDR